MPFAGTDAARFGDPGMTLVRAFAYSLSERACAACGLEYIIAELLIRDGRLVELTNPMPYRHVRELLLEGEGGVPRYHDDLFRTRSRS